MRGVHPHVNNRVRYTLMHKTFGNIYITEPEGWNEDGKEYARNMTYDGIFPKFSNNLKFVGNGSDWIKAVISIYGINAKIRLLKEYLDDDYSWKHAYTGFLDIKTRRYEDRKVSIKFHSGGLEELLKNRRNDKVELESEQSVLGYPIPPLETALLRSHGRRIFLRTDFEIPQSTNYAALSVETNAGNTRYAIKGLPIQLNGQSHDFAQTVIPQVAGLETQGFVGMMFYDRNDRDRIIRVNINLDLNIFFQQYENVQWCFYQASLVIYEGGADYTVKERIQLDRLDSALPFSDPKGLQADFDAPFPQFNKQLQLRYDENVNLLEGESMAIEVYLKSDMYFDNNAGVRANVTEMTGEGVFLEEDSNFPESITTGVMMYEALERTVTIMTGRTDQFKSDFYGRTDIGYEKDGEGAMTMIDHGLWKRGFSKDDRLYKPIKTSFKEASEASNVIHNTGVGIERIGFRERIIVEDRDFFYNPNVTIRLGKVGPDGVFRYTQVKDVVREEARDWYASAIEVGSKKGGEYEEVMGLEETNTSANYTTPIDGIENTYRKLTDWRLDTYGPEIIRRRNKEVMPNTDQTADQDIFLSSVKRGFGGVYDYKRDVDVLQSTPEGMFSPETSFNFEYSPVNILMKHKKNIASGLTKNRNGEIVFGSSRGQSSVVMQLNGQNEYAENGNIPVSDLGRPTVYPEEITFTFQIDNEMISLLEGTTFINGKEVPNMYGTVEFLNEDGIIERGFIKNVKVEKNEFKLLKSYR